MRFPSWPVIAVALIVANALAWVLVQGMGFEPGLSRSICSFGLISGELLGTLPEGTRIALGAQGQCLTSANGWHTVLTSMFMHGSWLHIIGNMWFLWVFGNNVEDAMGHLRFLVFYLLSGFAAAGLQVALSNNPAVPMVGASGGVWAGEAEREEAERLAAEKAAEGSAAQHRVVVTI